MHLPALIQDLAILLGIATIVTLLFRKLRQPVVLGYLVAGMILGNDTFPAEIIDTPNINIWGELGVIFLMFSIGLHFSFRKLMRVGVSATTTGLFQVTMLFLLGTFAGHMLGLSRIDSLFLGGMLSISSTTIILRAFDELHLRTRRFSDVVLGVLIIEDLIAILMIVGLSTAALTESFVPSEILFAAVKLIFIVGSWFVVGYFFIPTFLRYAGKHLDDEATIVLATSLCLGLVAAAGYFGYSAALGAFIMGSILAETREAPRIERLLEPVKMLFAAVFFTSVGLLVEFKVIAQYWQEILWISSVLVGGKILSATFGAILAGESPRNAVRIGFSLAQIGEFSFIIAALGTSLKVTSPFIYPVIVAVSVITTFLTPFLIRLSEPVGIWLESKLPARLLRTLQERAETVQREASGRSSISIRQTIRFSANAIATTLVFLCASTYLLPRVQVTFNNAPLASFATWLITIFSSAPFVWGMFFAYRTPDKVGEEIPSAGNTGIAAFFGHLVCVVWVGALSDLFFATTLSLTLTLVTSFGLFFLFYQRLERSYSKIEARFLSNISQKPHDDDASLSRLAPWDLHLVRVQIEANSPISGKTLREVDPRNRFHLNVVAIERGDMTTSPPTADDFFFPGDQLLVLGEDSAIDEFRAMTNAPPLPPEQSRSLTDFKLRREIVSQDSPYLEKSIRDSQIRQKSASVLVGLERAGTRYLNPNPELKLSLGDTLWLVGRTD